MKEISDYPDDSIAIESVLADVIGCKWTLVVLGRIARGVVRPGELLRSIPDLSQKVLQERLDKLQRFGLVARHAFAEVPPRVEYRLTTLGAEFVPLLDAVRALQDRLPGLAQTPQTPE